MALLEGFFALMATVLAPIIVGGVLYLLFRMFPNDEDPLK